MGVAAFNPALLLSKEMWKKPLEGWVKVNFDGASKGNPGPSGAGFIVRD